MTDKINPGDIWRSMWGHDQTNIDFYEVLRVTKTTVTLVKIEQFRKSDGDMGGYTKPIAGAHVGDPMRRKVQWYDGKPFAKLANYSMAPIARPYDGRVMHYTTYA